jgi:hypothetical protein
MSIHDFLSRLEPDRKKLLAAIHELIVQTDKSVEYKVSNMMGKEMIVYEASGIMKYALSAVKNYMSLHIMPIYGSPRLHTKYQNLLNEARFQKGCINFRNSGEMPLDIVRQLLTECAPIDLAAFLQEYKMKKKTKKN